MLFNLAQLREVHTCFCLVSHANSFVFEVSCFHLVWSVQLSEWDLLATKHYQIISCVYTVNINCTVNVSGI